MQLISFKNATHKIISVNTQGIVTLSISNELICVYFQKQLTCVSWLAGTLVSIDLVDALAIVAWVALTVVQIDLTVNTCEAKAKSSQMLQQN